MQRRMNSQLKQPSLRLQVQSTRQPVQYESEPLLRALADLLLEACGIMGEEQESRQGGVHELEDHV